MELVAVSAGLGGLPLGEKFCNDTALLNNSKCAHKFAHKFCDKSSLMRNFQLSSGFPHEAAAAIENS
jgi:hypothetical protein